LPYYRDYEWYLPEQKSIIIQSSGSELVEFTGNQIQFKALFFSADSLF